MTNLNQNINLSILNTASVKSVDLLASTPKPSYMDKSCDFNSFLDTANKTYAKGTTSSKTDFNKISDTKTDDAKTKVNGDFNDAADKKEVESKKDDKISDNKDDQSKGKNQKEKPEEQNVSKTDADSADSKKTKASKSDDKVTAKSEDDSNKAVKTEVKADDAKVDDQAKSPTEDSPKETALDPTQSQQSPTQTAETLTAAAIAALAQGDKSNTAKTTDNKTVADTSQSTQALQSSAKEPATETDLSQLAQASKDLTETNSKPTIQSDKLKNQSQMQQILLNLKVDNENTTASKSVADEVTDAQQNATASDKNQIAQAPMVQANAQLLANIGATSKSLPKQTMAESLQKTGLAQELVDKLNVQVTNVQTVNSSSGSNGSDLLSQQNAQEQGMKMALENSSNLTNSSSATNSTTQTNFAKTVEDAQQAKELDKTDILSQIHTKMETLKDDSTTKVTIILKPENLGKISLELINGKDGLTAKMTTENAQVKELLDKNLESLRGSLGTQGVNVNNVSIKVAETQEQSNASFNFEQQQEQNAQQFSKNSQNSDGRAFSQEEDFVNMANNGDSQGGEETVETTSHTGQVDYKI